MKVDAAQNLNFLSSSTGDLTTNPIEKPRPLKSLSVLESEGVPTPK